MDRSLTLSGLSGEPSSLLNETLYPDDAYKGEIYWADLPSKERTFWINEQSNSEARRELNDVWQIFKKDPIRPLLQYLHNYAITGLGFFTEGYTLFSVRNILILFQAVWPNCYKNYQICDEVWVQSVNYLEIVGIILGQVVVGFTGDWIGRRWGMIQDAIIMFIGTILLTAMWGDTLNGWVIMYAWSLLVFGIGVGGEYPMTSITAMEGVHGRLTDRQDKLHRGRTTLLAFLMQGWGQVINQLILILALLVFHSGGSPPFGETATQWTFRVSFAFIAICLLYFIYIRIFKLKNADQSVRAFKKRGNVTGYDVASLRLVARHYWHRLLATSICWFCNDFPFYGNQIFRTVFLQLVAPSSSDVVTIWLYNLINVGCELAGYYLAAILIDHKSYGRKRMQGIGFIMSFILFIIAAGTYPQIDKKGQGAQGYEFIYFFSSFWIQFGPNSTTFLVAAEVYPAPIRATAHGVSAAVGKLGALTATVLYNYIGSRTKFWVVSWFGLIGFFITMTFIPDTTGLDLREQERYWQLVKEGREHDYHGIAIHPRHLSLWERVILKRDANYNPKLDKQAKIEDLRKLFDRVNMRKGDESIDESEETLSDKVSSYFVWEKGSAHHS